MSRRKRKGRKAELEQSILTPRLYTTDFQELDLLFSLQHNPALPIDEVAGGVAALRADYNRRHFVHGQDWAAAAARLSPSARATWVDFLERAVQSEFSGFLLFREMSRRLAVVNPVLSEALQHMSRDEARHAGVINTALGDFGVALDLGFLSSSRKYTSFAPKHILYATFLSERIGYQRYIALSRHLQQCPAEQLPEEPYPFVRLLERWSQDENRHGDVLAAVLKSHPELLRGTANKLWSRFFCLSVYTTMYLNDAQRAAFFQLHGLHPERYSPAVIRDTNAAVRRTLPEVPDVEAPGFFETLQDMAGHNQAMCDIDASAAPSPLKVMRKAVHVERLAASCLRLFFAFPILKGGPLEFDPSAEARYVY
eukprot:scaffold6.g2600.t1